MNLFFVKQYAKIKVFTQYVNNFGPWKYRKGLWLTPEEQILWDQCVGEVIFCSRALQLHLIA